MIILLIPCDVLIDDLKLDGSVNPDRAIKRSIFDELSGQWTDW